MKYEDVFSMTKLDALSFLSDLETSCELYDFFSLYFPEYINFDGKLMYFKILYDIERYP